MPDFTPAAVLAAAQTMYEKLLVEGTAGNVSGRMRDGTVCVTPSSKPYDTMTEDELVIVDLDGAKVGGGGEPTTEQALHLACYRAHPEVGGVLHCHPLHASMFAVARLPIPASIEEAAIFTGGDVPVCEYHTTGTDELGAEVAAHLGDRGAALMANHGLVCVGVDPADALHTAIVVERTAQIVWGARLLGASHDLPAKVKDDFAGVYSYVRSTWT